MRILFAISLVALAALLWASVSIAHHIRRARHRQRPLSQDKRRTLKTVPAARVASATEDAARQRKAS